MENTKRDNRMRWIRTWHLSWHKSP